MFLQCLNLTQRPTGLSQLPMLIRLGGINTVLLRESREYTLMDIVSKLEITVIASTAARPLSDTGRWSGRTQSETAGETKGKGCSSSN